MDGKMLARLAAVIFVAVAITVTIIEMAREDDAGPAPAAPVLQPSTDPLRLEQRRCQELGEAAANDATCLRVWSQTRDRFLGRSPAPETPAAREGR
ncbi:MAG: putative entry exclusion protein TrbK-alt [Rhizobiales bacterium]|jgi:conjugative transfer region protein TrbK|nr:putative entry exclusion protein TrbK-alt [Hyphomicrobiales bacterium]